jgi:stage II sporulation protein AB (anti-sigma F factor)
MYEQLPATVPGVARARRTVRRFVGGLDVDVDGVVLAVSEAVTNAVTHAYPDGIGIVEMAGSSTPDAVTVTVRDHGCGLQARPDGAGFGLEIIQRLAEHVAVDDSPDGVALTMRFARGAPWAD